MATLTPPLHFNRIHPGLYRGSYPRPINYTFLQSLALKTIIAITPETITEENDKELYDFCQKNNISVQHIDCQLSGKGKKRGVPLDYEKVTKILELIINADKSPVYMYCINGGQITSLVVACLRKISFWSSISIYNEFITYATTINHNDRVFIENFQVKLNVPDNKVSWLWTGLNKNVIENHPSITII